MRIVVVTGVTNFRTGPNGSGSLLDFFSSRKQVPPPDAFFQKPVDSENYVAQVKGLTGV